MSEKHVLSTLRKHKSLTIQARALAEKYCSEKDIDFGKINICYISPEVTTFDVIFPGARCDGPTLAFPTSRLWEMSTIDKIGCYNQLKKEDEELASEFQEYHKKTDEMFSYAFTMLDNAIDGIRDYIRDRVDSAKNESDPVIREALIDSLTIEATERAKESLKTPPKC